MRGNVTIQHAPHPERHAGEAISRLLGELKGTLRPTLLLASGGSSREVLDHIDEKVLGEHLTVSMVDERMSTEHGVNNFLELMKCEFYEKALARGVAFISSLPQEGEDMEATAFRWEESLRRWKEEHGGTVAALLGIGQDGHTAGIMPFPEDPEHFDALFRGDRWIVSYDAGKKNTHPLRITATISFLETCVDHAFFFLKGENKSSILKTVLRSREVAAYPASVMHHMKDVSIYTDIGEEEDT